MSDPSSDPFVYPGTNTLKNKFGIKDQGRLSYFEGALATYRMAEIAAAPITGHYDLKHLRDIHRHIFQDIYPWAGETRENLHLAIGKARPDGSPVTYPPGPMAIIQARKILDELKAEKYLQGKPADELAGRLAHYYAELDYCHVFREGNSRTLRVFTASIARQAGHTLSWEHVRNRQEELYRARDHAAFSMPSDRLPDPLAPLAGIIREGLNAPAPERARSVAAGLEAIRAYNGDGKADAAPAELRGVFKHLDRIRVDTKDITANAAQAEQMFHRLRERVADQFAAGYRFPDTGAAPTRPAPRTRGRDDDRTR